MTSTRLTRTDMTSLNKTNMTSTRTDKKRRDRTKPIRRSFVPVPCSEHLCPKRSACSQFRKPVPKAFCLFPGQKACAQSALSVPRSEGLCPKLPACARVGFPAKLGKDWREDSPISNMFWPVNLCESLRSQLVNGQAWIHRLIFINSSCHSSSSTLSVLVPQLVISSASASATASYH